MTRPEDDDGMETTQEIRLRESEVLKRAEELRPSERMLSATVTKYVDAAIQIAEPSGIAVYGAFIDAKNRGSSTPGASTVCGHR